MRILFMADTILNPDSGASGTEYQTILALRRLGHDVDEVWGDRLVRRIRHGNLHYLLELPHAYRSMMLKHLRTATYDVVHVNQPHGYLAARELRSVQAKAVFVHRSHGFEPRAQNALRPWLDRFEPRRSLVKRAATSVMERLLETNYRGIARFADGHIFSARLCAQYLIDHYGVDADRIAVIAQAPPERFRSDSEAAFNQDRLNRVLYVGQFAFFKAPMILAVAFEKILAARPDASLTWVCDAKHHQHAGALLSTRARERTRFLDWLPQDRLVEVYDRHGVFLFPSFFEGFGKVFLEAMTRGLIVIASNEGGARDAITHAQDGFVVATGNAAAMAAMCIDVQSNLDSARRISHFARQTALCFSWDRVAAETICFYSHLRQRKYGAEKDDRAGNG